MASSLNRAQIIGNVGKDPEVRNTQSGGKIVNLTIATSEKWKDRASGESKERTEWHRCVIFNPNLAEIAEKYVHKGSRIMIEGSIQTRKWTDQSGQDRYSTEIVLSQFNGQLLLLDSPRAGGDSEPRQQPARQSAGSFQNPPYGGQSRDAPPGRDLDDEIPF